MTASYAPTCSPWAGLDDLLAGASSAQSAERFRPAIERFAETVIEKCR
jgi:hypothetical protein